MVWVLLARLGIGAAAMVAAFLSSSPTLLCTEHNSLVLSEVSADGSVAASTSFSAEQPVVPFVGARCRVGIGDYVAEDIIVNWPMTALLALGTALSFLS